jgi:hypothetical protein
MQRQRTDRDGAGGNIGICLRACGKGSSKKLTIFGYKRHLLITLGGVILNFELAPANAGVPSLD